MRRVLLTGSCGLLGQYVVALCEGEGREGREGRERGDDTQWLLLSRVAAWREGMLPERFSFAHFDLTDREAFGRCVRLFRPDVIIHAAALTDVDHCERHPVVCHQQNVEVVEKMLSVVSGLDVFFIHLSTDFVFSGKDGPYDEDDVPMPINCYGRSKWLSECAVRASKLRWAILRTSFLYGAAKYWRRSNILLAIKDALRSEDTFTMVSDQYRTPTYAGDLAKMCYLIAQREITGIFHIAGSETLTPYAMARLVAPHVQATTEQVIPISSADWACVAPRPVHSGLVIDKAVRLLGYAPTPCDDAIKHMRTAL